MSDQPRTNNICEGWNNRLHTLVDQDRPSIWLLIETLQAECARLTGALIQDERDIRPEKKPQERSIENSRTDFVTYVKIDFQE